jgi:heme ABC exporter ATP-binding subunit CcmA
MAADSTVPAVSCESARAMGPYDFEQVEARGVGQLFGAVRALAGVDLTVRAGETSLLLGPNGAGKSTLLRVLSTLLRPTVGEVRYGDRTGEQVGRALRSRIAYLGHRTQLHAELSGRECLEQAAALHGLGSDASMRLPEAFRRLSLDPFVDRPVRTYSRGQAQRVALARVLLARPRLLLLDEPTTGLDRSSVGVLRDLLLDEARRGTMTLVSTHEPAALDGVFHRVIEMRGGRIASDAPAPGRPS